MIDSFTGQYAFLSNFHRSGLRLRKVYYPTREHAFQAQKTLSTEQQWKIASLETPADAKRAGRSLELRPDWNDIRKQAMFTVVLECFDQHPDLAELLDKTGNTELVEGNYWHDCYWGYCYCNGCYSSLKYNYLGKTLMYVRDILRKD